MLALLLSLFVLSPCSPLYLSLCSALSDRLPISESQHGPAHAPVGQLILLISLKSFLSSLVRERARRGLGAVVLQASLLLDENPVQVVISVLLPAFNELVPLP